MTSYKCRFITTTLKGSTQHLHTHTLYICRYKIYNKLKRLHSACATSLCVYWYIYTQTYGLHECEVSHSAKIVCISTVVCWGRSVTVSLFGIVTKLSHFCFSKILQTKKNPLVPYYIYISFKHPQNLQSPTGGTFSPLVAAFSKNKNKKKPGFSLLLNVDALYISHFWCYRDMWGKQALCDITMGRKFHNFHFVFGKEKAKYKSLGS